MHWEQACWCLAFRLSDTPSWSFNSFLSEVTFQAFDFWMAVVHVTKKQLEFPLKNWNNNYEKYLQEWSILGLSKKDNIVVPMWITSHWKWKLLRPVYTCNFWCDFAHKTCPSLPCTGFYSRNAAKKYRQASRKWKEGCLEIICDNFFSNPRDTLWKKTFVQGRVRSVLLAK